MKIRSYLKKIPVLLTVMLLTGITVFQSGSVFVHSASGSADDELSGSPLKGEFAEVATSEKYSLIVSPETGNFFIKSGDTVTYSSNPEETEEEMAEGVWKNVIKSQIVVGFCNQDGGNRDTVNSFVYSVNKGGYEVYAIKNGFAAKYYFPKQKFTVWLYVRLNGSYADVWVPFDKIVDSESYRLTSVDILPAFCAAKSDEQGYVLLPDGCGGIMNYNHPTVSTPYSAKLYGEDLSIQKKRVTSKTNTAIMPVYGASRTKGSFLAVITDGDALATVNAMTAGNKTAYNLVYPAFDFLSFDSYTIKDWSNKTRSITLIENHDLRYDRLAIRYYFLEPSDGYLKMAEQYRKHLVKEEGLKQSTGADNNKLSLSLYGAVQKEKSVLGIPVTITQALTSYKQASELVTELESKKTQDILLEYRYATKSGVKHTDLSGNDYFSVLGSKKSMEKLEELVGGTALFIEADPCTVKKSNLAFWSLSSVCKNLYGTPSYLYQYNLVSGVGEESSRRMLNNLSKITSGIEKRAKNKSTVYLGGIGEYIYSDFGKKSVNRQEMADGYKTILSALTSQTLTVNTGNAYAWPYADRISGLTTEGSGDILIDQTIPFAQMVLRGYAGYSTEPVNLSANPQKAFLKAVESQSALSFSLIANDTELLKDTELSFLYGSNYSLWKETISDMSQKYKELLDKIDGSPLTEHQYIHKNLVYIGFENKTGIYINYSDEAQQVDNVTVDGLSCLIVQK